MRLSARFASCFRKNISLWILLCPMVAYLIAWRALPLLYTIDLGFHKFNLVFDNEPVFTGLRNYSNLLKDRRFLYSLWISLLFMFMATGLQLILGVPLALLANGKYRGKGILQGILILPMVVSPVAVGTIWYILYNAQLGPITYAVKRLGFIAPDWLGQTSTALYAVLIADIWQWTPFIFVLALSALQGIPEEIYEASTIDGCTGWNTLRFVTLPMIKPVLFSAAALRAMDALRIFETMYIMTGGGPGRATEVISILVYRTAFSQLNFGYAAAQVTVILLVTALLYWIYMRMFESQ